eukprot:3505398-Pyramimonas_sp.AAC.1
MRRLPGIARAVPWPLICASNRAIAASTSCIPGTARGHIDRLRGTIEAPHAHVVVDRSDAN